MFRSPAIRRAVFVVDGVERSDEVRRLRGDAATAVAFSGSDAKAGALLAQQCGARFYHVRDSVGLQRAIEDAAGHWPNVTLEVQHVG
ncbi:MAG: hypothetical protein NC230_09445 [Bacteroides sp.]|nr:hypothetical protein [Bacteroides sp.]